MHRDLKPGNVLFDCSTERLTIIDFGLATKRGLDATENGQALPTSWKPGTPGWRAPEVVAMRCKPATFASDMFVAGLLVLSLVLNLPRGIFNYTDNPQGLMRIVGPMLWKATIVCRFKQTAPEFQPSVAQLTMDNASPIFRCSAHATDTDSELDTVRRRLAAVCDTTALQDTTRVPRGLCSSLALVLRAAPWNRANATAMLRSSLCCVQKQRAPLAQPEEQQVQGRGEKRLFPDSPVSTS